MTPSSDFDAMTPSEDDHVDPELLAVLEEISERILRGDSIDIEAYAAAHSRYGEYLRELVGTLHAVASLGLATSVNDASPIIGMEGRSVGEFEIVRQIGRG
ncbi:MAG: hypothetical protein KDA61_06410, partial [Planctomycetales bacterium]|nr:hypothetical protein [Planctomycetales bacterium]